MVARDTPNVEVPGSSPGCCYFLLLALLLLLGIFMMWPWQSRRLLDSCIVTTVGKSLNTTSMRLPLSTGHSISTGQMQAKLLDQGHKMRTKQCTDVSLLCNRQLHVLFLCV